MGVHAFEMGEHDVSVEGVAMIEAGVLDDFVGHCALVFAVEVIAAARARLAVRHEAPSVVPVSS